MDPVGDKILGKLLPKAYTDKLVSSLSNLPIPEPRSPRRVSRWLIRNLVYIVPIMFLMLVALNSVHTVASAPGVSAVVDAGATDAIGSFFGALSAQAGNIASLVVLGIIIMVLVGLIAAIGTVFYVFKVN